MDSLLMFLGTAADLAWAHPAMAIAAGTLLFYAGFKLY